MDAVNSQMIPYHLTVDSLKSVFPKYVEANLVISPSVYVIGQGFGVTWGVKYAQVFPPSRLTAASVFSAVAELPSAPEEGSEPPHEDDGVRASIMSHVPPQEALAGGGGGGGGRRRKAA
jgi:hypothetical protein